MLIQDYKDTKNFPSLKEIEKIQEKLIEISLNKSNKNNIDKRYRNVKFLFNLYNHYFISYYNEYKSMSNEYVTKIKKYMDIFKNDESYYLKSLVLIFKDDNYENRISQVVYYCINLYMQYLKNLKNIKISSCYYSDALDLIDIFRNKIDKSNLKSQFVTLEKNCKIERDKLLIEIENKNNVVKKNLSNEEILSAIDQYSYVIENYGTPNENTPKKEKELRAYLLAKLVYFEFNFLNIKDLQKLKRMTEEALLLAEQCNLTQETDSWVKNLIEMNEKISKLIEEGGKNEINNIRNSLKNVNNKDIKGDDDKENIEFLKMFDSEFMKENKLDKTIENMYKEDPEKLINRRLSIINKLPDSGDSEVKEKKNWFKKQLNKIKNFFRKKKITNTK